MIRLLVMLARWWQALRRHRPDTVYPDVYLDDEEFDTPFADDRYGPHGELLDRQGERVDGYGKDTWTEGGRTFKRFADGMVGEDITDLDVSNVDELRRVYGTSPHLTDEDLQRWAAQAQAHNARTGEIARRLEEIANQPAPGPRDTGYIPTAGPHAGTSPKTGVVKPPAVEDMTTREWADLRLEQAYGPGALPRTLRPGASGFSMRTLHALARRAEARDRTLSAYDIAILRSRGLV